MIKPKIRETFLSEMLLNVRGKGQNYKNQSIEIQKFAKGSEHQKSPLKWSERQKIRTTTTTYGVVPMDTKACGRLS